MEATGQGSVGQAREGAAGVLTPAERPGGDRQQTRAPAPRAGGTASRRAGISAERSP